MLENVIFKKKDREPLGQFYFPAMFYLNVTEKASLIMVRFFTPLEKSGDKLSVSPH